MSNAKPKRARTQPNGDGTTINPQCVPSRNIPNATACLLWGRAAGRCQFPGCNRPLYRSSVTAQEINIAEKAHIYAFSSSGPRGHNGISESDLNSTSNLMLVCHDCHVSMDRGGGATRYPAEFLHENKLEHERRVEIVTGIDPSRQSHVLMYGAKVGVHTAPTGFNEAAHALLPDRYPAEARPISLGLINMDLDERNETFWQVESENLRKLFESHVRDRVKTKDISHLSVFALAPQPLLIQLGSLLADITPADVYQRHREPPSWGWPTRASVPKIQVLEPLPASGPPALVLGLSATVNPSRITDVLGRDVCIWSVSIPRPHNDVLKSKRMLSSLRVTFRDLLNRIKARHGETATLHIFPAAPAAANVELGRVRMPKADTTWIIYDQLGDRGFVQALTIARGA
jgi:hypothetical protein